MKEFKGRLKQELQQEAPFTNDLKQRLLQTKPKPKKRNWQVISVSVATCFILGILLFPQLFSQNQLHTASNQNEPLPILDDVSGLEVIEPQEANLLGEQWMLHFLPMVIERDATITYGDYVAYYTPTGITVSTVLGLANDSVTMLEGQVTVDGTELNVHGLGNKVDQSEKGDPFKNPYYFQEWGEVKTFVNNTVETSAEELVVYSDKEGHQLLKIADALLVGKVTAIQNFDLTFSLTAEEQAVFDDFKSDNNLQHLRNISPVATVKMYLLSEIEKDFKTYEALFTTVENEETLGIKQHFEKTKEVREKLFTKELNQLIIANTFQGLENAKFEQQSETEGIVAFTKPDDMTTEVSMRKNKQGIWQPAFDRTVYFPD